MPLKRIEKVKFLERLLDSYPIADLNREITRIYAEVDAYSQDKLQNRRLSKGLTARNMSKNDLWTVRRSDCRHSPLFGYGTAYNRW